MLFPVIFTGAVFGTKGNNKSDQLIQLPASFANSLPHSNLKSLGD